MGESVKHLQIDLYMLIQLEKVTFNYKGILLKKKNCLVFQIHMWVTCVVLICVEQLGVIACIVLVMFTTI